MNRAGRRVRAAVNPVSTTVTRWWCPVAYVGVVLLDRFTTAGFACAVRAHDIKSTVLAPAMIAMLVDDPAITELSPLRIVRSITAPLSPRGARRFHEGKLGAVGRPYRHVDLRIRRDYGSEADPGEHGEIFVRSPFRMGGYARAGEARQQEFRSERRGEWRLR